MPGIQRPVDGAEPADDELRTCRLERQSAKVEQGERVRLIILFLSLPAASNGRRFSRVSVHSVGSMVADALRVHF